MSYHSSPLQNIRNLLIILAIFLPSFSFFLRPSSSATGLLALPSNLPHVSPEMGNPQFWIRKIQNPHRIILSPEEVRKMNEINLRRRDLYLFDLNEIPEELSREESLAMMKEDWDAFIVPGEVRYGRNGTPLGDPFWNELKANLNQESLKEHNRTLLGLVVKRTDIRVFPTDEQSNATPEPEGFDRFQHSSISPGALVGIYHLSRDKRWAYVQTQFIRGWILISSLAISRQKDEALGYERTKGRLVIGGSFVNVFSDPSLQQVAFQAQMGNSFPLLAKPAQAGGSTPYTVIHAPFREIDSSLTFRKAYLPRNADVHEGFLPYTQENVVRQAFKMIGESYGWGEMSGGRDCSRFIMDIFASCGIVMPRNSKFQAMVGKDLGAIEGKKVQEKRHVLDRAVPCATLLRLPGHIMLYLGKDHGRYYAIHSLWAVQRSGASGRALDKINRVVVSDLSLGSSGSNGSLLDRLTDVRLIGNFGNLP